MKPSGLPNMGATCYYNSVVQLLKTVCDSVPSIHEFLKKYPNYTLGQPHDAHDCLLDIIDMIGRKDFYGTRKVTYTFPGGSETKDEPFCSIVGQFQHKEIQTLESFRNFHLAVCTKEYTEFPKFITWKSPSGQVSPPFDTKLVATIHYIPGHYFACVLSEDQWYIVDDETVIECKEPPGYPDIALFIRNSSG